MNESKMRRQKGAAVTGLVLALFLFIMMIGFFTFDTCRLQMAQRELTATCDAAALAGTAMLTSQDISNDDTNDTKLLAAQQNASGYARNMFQAGNMLGATLVGATTVSNYSATKVLGNPGECKVMISLADPQNEYVGVPPTSPQCRNGRAIMCYAGYTYKPVFMSMIGVQKVGLNAFSGGGLPQVDAVLVFDYSGSMDDATSVTFIRRAWNPNATPLAGSASNTLSDMATGVAQANKGAIAYYEIPSDTVSSDGNRLASYIRHNYANNANGLNVNVLPPMNLQLVDNSDSQASPHFAFDDRLRVNTIPYSYAITYTTPGNNLHSHFQADYGTPPGNCTLQPAFTTPFVGGYGKFWDSGTSVTSTNPSTFGLAYQPNPATNTGPDQLQGPATPQYNYSGRYDPNNTATISANRRMTDLVVNIASPGSFPYLQPLNGPNTFSGFSYTFPSEEPDATIRGQQFDFENLAVVVEAARGNLDPDASVGTRRFQWAMLDRGSTLYLAPAYTGVSTGLTISHVKTGYQLAYQRLAMLFSQPIATAIDGADGGFFQKINTLTDCRFGFVGFSNRAGAGGSAFTFDSLGTDHGTGFSDHDSFYVSMQFNGKGIRHMDRGYPTNSTSPDRGDPSQPEENGTTLPSGSGFRTPRHVLDKNEAQLTALRSITGCRKASSIASGTSAAWSAFDNNADADGLENGRPVDNTDCGEAMTAAYNMFINAGKYDVGSISMSRAAGKHAIVFFTDGVPTSGDSGSEATEARSRADDCRAKGIAIFTIGLDVTGNPVLQSTQSAFLGSGSNGLAGKAKNGGKFFPCASAETVKQSFAAVARRLTQSQR
ncbi:MAG: VWA domain-containing protein [Candidatus Obscuribacter sp.]|nr:VWA domain-containing protein [Candidatus Obscuribacter sp.]